MRLLLIVAAMAAAHSGTASGRFSLPSRTADTAVVRREIEQWYDANKRAFLAKDVAAIMSLRTDDFHTVGPDGQQRSRADMQQYTVGLLNGIEKWIAMEFRVDSIKVDGDIASAVVRQHLVRMALRPDERVHRVETWATQNETWKKTAGGWKLYRVENVRDQKRLIDGKEG